MAGLRDALRVIMEASAPRAGETNAVRMFAGPMARTADQEALSRAQQLAQSGSPREQIWNDTGWFQGVDGKWRFEIDDSGARLRTNEEVQALGEGMIGRARELEQGVRARNAALREQPDFFPATVRRANGEARAEARGLRERANEKYGPSWNEYNGRRMEYDFEHPELYQAYPEVGRDVIVARPGMSQIDPGVRGSYNDSRITLRRSGDQTSTTLHETQHHLQDVEGFARGGSGSSAYMSGDMRGAWVAETERILTPPSYEQFAANETFRGVPEAEVRAQYDKMVRDLAAARRDMYSPISRNAQETAAYNIYRRLAGEVEARNTQTRQAMGRSERRARPPWTTQDVPDDQQIVRFGDDGPSNALGDVLRVSAGLGSLGLAGDFTLRQYLRDNMQGS